MSFLSLSLSPLSTNLLLLSVHVRPLVAADAVGGARRHARPGGRLKRYLGKSMANSLPSSRLHHTKGLTTTSCNRPRTPLPTWQSKCSRAWSRRWLELCASKKCVSNGVLLERQNIAIIIIGSSVADFSPLSSLRACPLRLSRAARGSRAAAAAVGCAPAPAARSTAAGRPSW